MTSEALDQGFRIVAEAIARQFNIDASEVSPATVAMDVDGWDSFSNGLLIMALEEAVGRPLPFDALVAAENVGEMAAVVARSLAS
jgi:acyl carrier protein